MAVIDGRWLSKEGLTYFWSKIKSIFTKQTETNVIANLGAKNLLLVTGTTSTVGSVAYTVNEDGTITANGQASSNSDWSINSSLHLEPGTYKLTGCPAGGNNSSTYKIQIQGVGYDTGDGLTFTVASATNVNVYARVWSGYNASNLVFKPMIRPVEITDDTFQPYAPSNRELYETKAEQAEVNAIADLGAKNLLRLGFADKAATSSNPSVTKTADGTGFEVDGTRTSANETTLVYDLVTGMTSHTATRYSLPAGKYRVSATGNPKLKISIYCHNGASASRLFLGSDEGVFTYTASAKTSKPYIAIQLVTAGSASYDHFMVYPMIRRAEITDDTFQPYAPSNRELYEMLLCSKNVLPAGTDLNKLKTPGLYNGGDVTGRPTSGTTAFMLMVIELNECVLQVFKQLNGAGDPYIFVRRFYVYNTSWDSWYQFTGTAV